MLIGNGLLNVIETSLLAHCKALAQAINADLGYNFKMEYFEGYTYDEVLPQQDIIGPWKLELEVDEKIVSGTFLITLSTLNDSGCFRLRNAISLVFDDLKPMREIPLFQPDGTPLQGSLVILTGGSMLPMEEGLSRPAKTLALPFKCTRTIGL